MRLAIRHETIYAYVRPFFHTIQQLRLTPRIEPHQVTLDWEIHAPAPLDHSVDAFGNQMHTFTLAQQVARIRVSAGGVVETRALEGGRLHGPASHFIAPLTFSLPTWYTASDARIESLALAHPHARTDADRLLALAEAVCGAIRYQSGATQVTSTALDALALGKGVCQDQAHLFIAACHVLGVPCRYVSGYFYPGEKTELASHAWVDAWLPTDGAGGGDWISVDVTHVCFASERYVRLAVGRDYETAAPIRGVRTGGGEEQLRVNVSVNVIG